MKAKLYIYIIILVSLFYGCIEEISTPLETESFQDNALMLKELERRGDFINSVEFPALVEADEVYGSLNDYFIIDVRNAEDYSQGHIENSVNVLPENLYDYAVNLDLTNKKILLVSNTGQAAAYYLTLLRYTGMDNVYSLRFGMGVWNRDFENLWKDNIYNFIDDNGSRFTPQFSFNHIAQYFKPEHTSFPPVVFNKQEMTADEMIAERIKYAISLGFDEKSNGNINTGNTIGIEYLTSRDYKNTNEFYIICFANAALYFRPQTSRGCLLQCSSHPWGTYLYNAFPPYSDLKSATDLQTLPNNKPIIIYSFTGERSAMAVAYLKIFGYDAKSVNFGGQYMFHSRFVTTNYNSSELLASFGVIESSYRNYPYSK